MLINNKILGNNMSRKFLMKCVPLLLLSCLSFGVKAQSNSNSETIVVDNLDVENTIGEGRFWRRSGGPSPFGTDSVYAFNSKDKRFGPARFTWLAQTENRKYKVEVYFTYFRTRVHDAKYSIDTADGVKEVSFNQRDPELGGRWLDAGTYMLNAGETRVILTTDHDRSSLSADAVRFIPVIETEPPIESTVKAKITPSRTQCASPCTVVFSADKTTADGFDEHGVWSQLSYHWDFGTNEQGAAGNYRYTGNETSHAVGHLPMVTKTFLCDEGVCSYDVGMRAQNEKGEYDDDFVTITVMSEASTWNVSNTICVSNTLNVNDDWTNFDKACPEGATKQNALLDYDQYDGKLVLFMRGDRFTHSNNPQGRLPIVVATLPDQSNFKLGYFGNDSEAKPHLNGLVALGKTNFGGPRNAPSAANTLNLTDALVERYGWTKNVTAEGLKIDGFDFPGSFENIGMHDIDMDASDIESTGAAGRIGINEGSTECHHRSNLSCSNVPFPKGAYISSVDVVGNAGNPPGLNIGQTQCSMINFLGITDSKFQLAYEHSLRIAGWYRINIMKSYFPGGHYQPVNFGKNSKITLRSCNRSGGDWERGVWANDPHRPVNWDQDVMNDDGTMRTRADADSTSTNSADVGYREHVHMSRYQLIANNRLGSSSLFSPEPDGVMYSTNVSRTFPEDLLLYQDAMLAHNVFERQEGGDPVGEAITIGRYATCVANNHPRICIPSFVPPEMPNYRNDVAPTESPAAPGS